MSDGLLGLVSVIEAVGRVGEIIPASNFTSWSLRTRDAARRAIPGQVMTPEVIAAFARVGGLYTFDRYVDIGGPTGSTVIWTSRSASHPGPTAGSATR